MANTVPVPGAGAAWACGYGGSPGQRREGNGLFDCNGDGLCSRQLIVSGLPLPGYKDLQFGLSRPATLKNLWQNRRPDAVYVATQGLGIAAVSAARKLQIPVISGFHTNFHSYSRYYGVGALERLLCAYGRWFHNRTA